MSKSARVPEPSMEEILASIRRIIADDSAPAQEGSTASNPAPEQELHEFDTSEPTSPAEADLLELTQPVEPDPAPAFTPVRGADVMFREEERRGPEPVPAAPLPSPVRAPTASAPPAPRGPALREDLLSPSSTAAVSAAFNSLASTVLSENARTLEDIVKEIMRPMLKAWLNENLPGLVERMVRAEIERVSRGGR